MRKSEADFSGNIIFKQIYQNGKARNVACFESGCYEEIVSKYLKRKIDIDFTIKYPNRSRIMKEFFELAETLPNMSDFTIYKFDFRNFFDSINGQQVYKDYFKRTNLFRFEVNLLEKLLEVAKTCTAGIPTSNALTEVVSCDFDKRLKTVLAQHGLIFYSRYVDDVMLVFNRFVDNSVLEDKIKTVIEDVFSAHSVTINPEKSVYLSKSNLVVKTFSYLGYNFRYDESNKVFIYGIEPKKIEKYMKRYRKILLDYKKTNDITLFKERYDFFVSRVVFYNNFGSSANKVGKWEVIGISENYSELRHFIDHKKPQRIDSTTSFFLTHSLIKETKNTLGNLPYFLKEKSRKDKNNNEQNNIWIKTRMKHNKSIVFHPHIGWNARYLVKRIENLMKQTIYHNCSYRGLVKWYCSLIKVEEVD